MPSDFRSLRPPLTDPDARTAERLAALEERMRRAESGGVAAYSLSAASQLDILVTPVDRLLLLEFNLVFSNGSGELRAYPDNISGNIYSTAADRTTNNQGAEAHDPWVSYNHNNGAYLTNRSGGGGGGMRVLGRSMIELIGPTGATGQRQAISHAAATNTVGSGNQTVEDQTFSTLMATSAVFTYVRLVATASTITGTVWATTR